MVPGERPQLLRPCRGIGADTLGTIRASLTRAITTVYGGTLPAIGPA